MELTEPALVKHAETTLLDFIDKNKRQLERVIPKHMTPDRMLGIMVGAIRRVPKLLECDRASVLNSVLHITQLGLEIRPGQAYLIPFGRECTPIIDYRGKIELALRSEKVSSVEAQVVFEADEFDLQYGTEKRLIHKPLLWRTENGRHRSVTAEERGEPALVYGVAKMRNGESVVEGMSIAQVEAIRARSAAEKARAKGWIKNPTPWETDWEQMARKTLVHRVCKFIPQSPELAYSQALDDASDSGERMTFQNIETGLVLDVDPESSGPILPASEEAQDEVFRSKMTDGAAHLDAKLVAGFLDLMQKHGREAFGACLGRQGWAALSEVPDDKTARKVYKDMVQELEGK